MKHALLSITIAALVAGCGGSDPVPAPSTSGSPSLNAAALAALHVAVPATTLFTSAHAQVAPVPARHGPAVAGSAPVYYIDGIGFEPLAILPTGPGGALLYVQCAQYPDGRRACENIAPYDDVRMFTISVGQAADSTPFTVFQQDRVPKTASQSHQWSILIGAFNERFAEVVADLRAGAATVRAPGTSKAKDKPSGTASDEPDPARQPHVANNCTTDDDGIPCVIIHGDPPRPDPPGGPAPDSPPPNRGGDDDDNGKEIPGGGLKEEYQKVKPPTLICVPVPGTLMVACTATVTVKGTRPKLPPNWDWCKMAGVCGDGGTLPPPPGPDVDAAMACDIRHFTDLGACWKDYMLRRSDEKATTACVADAKLTAEQCHKEVGGFAPLTLNGVPLHRG